MTEQACQRSQRSVYCRNSSTASSVEKSKAKSLLRNCSQNDLYALKVQQASASQQLSKISFTYFIRERCSKTASCTCRSKTDKLLKVCFRSSAKLLKSLSKSQSAMIMTKKLQAVTANYMKSTHVYYKKSNIISC